MMAILDSFTFELDPKSRGAVEYAGLDSDEDFRYAQHKKIDAFDTWQDVSKWGQKLSIKGDLILKKNKSTDPISALAKKKTKVPFVTGTGDVWMVIVMSFKRGRSVMDKQGLFFRVNYTIELQEVLD